MLIIYNANNDYDNYYDNNLLSESAVITGKYQTEVLTLRTESGGGGGEERDPYMKDRGLIFSRDDQTDEVNKRFII